MTDTVDVPSNELNSDATVDATDAVSDATGAETVEAPADDAPAESPMEAPVRVIPDRADAPVSEVTERFLRAVVANVPLELIEELHLFSPLRQGTVETGIAVLAARVPVPVVVLAEPELALDEEVVVEAQADGVVAAEGSDEQPHAEEQLHAEGAEELLAENAEEQPAVDGEIAEVVLVAEEVAAEAQGVDGDAPDVEVIAEEMLLAENAEIAEGSPIAGSDEALSEVVHVAAEIAAHETPVAVVRHTVYTARYRYVIKGPERGKWEANVKAEAEAPLITVETVVRGVQRRAGEDSEIVRFTQAQIAKALRMVLS